MSAEIYITGSTIIHQNKVLKNGSLLFTNKDANAPDFFLSAYQFLGEKYPKFYKMDNLSKLGWLASEVLLKDNFITNKFKPEEVGVILCNANSSLEADLKYIDSTKTIASPALFVYTLPNIVIGEICIRHQFKGENGFFIFENFDADFIVNYVTILFNDHILNACICGWIEAMGEDYKAVFFWIEKSDQAANISQHGQLLFTKENLNNLSTNG